MGKDWFTIIKNEDYNQPSENIKKNGLEKTNAYWAFLYIKAKANSNMKEFIQNTQNVAMKCYSDNAKSLINNYQESINWDLSELPSPAALIKVNFTLKTPYLSHDNEDFYFVDNPVAKDTVYQVPLIHGTSWKGLLRHACFQRIWQELNIDLFDMEDAKVKVKIDPGRVHEYRMKIFNIFGNENDNMELIWTAIYNELNLDQEAFKKLQEKRLKIAEGVKGRLRVYSSVFKPQDNADLICYELINPHDRTTRASKRGPILIEGVSAGSTAELTLLYFPYDLVFALKKTEQENGNSDEIKGQVMGDLELICKSINDLLTMYGISAKTKAGYGLCDVKEVHVESSFLDESSISHLKKLVSAKA